MKGTLIFTLFLGQTEAPRDEKNSFPGQALLLHVSQGMDERAI